MFSLNFSQLCLLCQILDVINKDHRVLNQNDDYKILFDNFSDLYMIAEYSDKVEFYLTK